MDRKQDADSGDVSTTDRLLDRGDRLLADSRRLLREVEHSLRTVGSGRRDHADETAVEAARPATTG